MKLLFPIVFAFLAICTGAEPSTTTDVLESRLNELEAQLTELAQQVVGAPVELGDLADRAVGVSFRGLKKGKGKGEGGKGKGEGGKGKSGKGKSGKGEGGKGGKGASRKCADFTGRWEAHSSSPMRSAVLSVTEDVYNDGNPPNVTYSEPAYLLRMDLKSAEADPCILQGYNTCVRATFDETSGEWVATGQGSSTPTSCSSSPATTRRPGLFSVPGSAETSQA